MASVLGNLPEIAAGNSRYLRFKKYAYLVFLTPPAIPVVAYLLGVRLDAPNLFAFFTFFYIYGLVPILDVLLGRDSVNPDEADVAGLSAERFYRLLNYLCLPIIVALVTWGAYIFATWESLNWVGKLGWAGSIGLVSSALAINGAHEMIHKTTRLEQTLGGLLLSMVCYGSFKVEHLRGHHVNVSTPEDASSSRYNESLYHFLPRAIWRNSRNAWRLEAERLRRLGLAPFGLHNELIHWYGLSLLWLGCFALWLGWAGVVFFLLQSFAAILLLEIVNYLEHYGLHRRKLANGRYERTTHRHSWNSDYLLSNLLLFQLQRHSDHHAHPRRRYQVLRHFDDSPQLPAGYATMILLALIPPLWRRVMNPRVEAYYRDEPGLLDA